MKLKLFLKDSYFVIIFIRVYGNTLFPKFNKYVHKGKLNTIQDNNTSIKGT